MPKLINHFLICILSLAGFIQSAHADNITEISLSLNLPKIDSHPYHKPYVAIWLEDDNRKPVTTLTLWAKEDTWYKDLRQWWRKLGRTKKPPYDTVTGATHLPGKHKITWELFPNGKQPEADQLQSLPPGKYLLNIEASREEGGRSYFRFPIQLEDGLDKTFNMDGELGDLHISVSSS